MTTTATAPTPPVALAESRDTFGASLTAFLALLRRDVHVLRRTFRAFLLRTFMQPLLTVFVFTYVFPKIGQGIGGSQGAAGFSSLFVPGVVATACIFQGIQSVALPLVQDFGYTKEIEDRVLAPLPVSWVAVEKVASGAIQSLIAALVVFPMARFIPATPVHLEVRWLVLATVVPIACVLGAALGLAIGTRAEPTQVPLVFSVIVIPMTFLGATYYPWARLSPIQWLHIGVLINPLVYMSEAFRAALTPAIPHMSLWALYPAMLAITGALMYLGVTGFNRRVLA